MEPERQTHQNRMGGWNRKAKTLKYHSGKKTDGILVFGEFASSPTAASHCGGLGSQNGKTKPTPHSCLL